MTEPSVNASTTALSTTQGQELSNLQALLSLAQQLQAELVSTQQLQAELVSNQQLQAELVSKLMCTYKVNPASIAEDTEWT